VGELIWHEMDTYTAAGQWSVEKRFRVTEVFLAVLVSSILETENDICPSSSKEHIMLSGLGANFSRIRY
jgi:hypothetical protein